MKLTKQQALTLHRQMWSDMQKDLGDTPTRMDRVVYKEKWIEEHFPDEDVCNYCFLCEYDRVIRGRTEDDWHYSECNCLIRWPQYRCETGHDKYRWTYMPISELLVLPEREEEK